MNRRKARWPVIAVVLLAGAVLAAQAPGPAPVGSSTQKPTFRASVDLVTNDVIVRDARGQFVADLKDEEFEIYEDGVLQGVASLVLVHGGRVTNMTLPPPPPPPEGIILPPPRPTNDASGRIFILFVDDLHLDFKNTARVRDLLKKIKANLIHQGDMFGIVSSGPSSIAIDLTYDTKRIDEALKKVMGGALKPTDVIQGPEGQDGPTEVRYRAHVAFSTVADLLDNLSKVHNRRKAVIYVSNGYDFNPFEKSRNGEQEFFENKFGTGNTSASSSANAAQDPNSTDTSTNTSANSSMDRSGQKFANADLVRELAELTRAANRANATIYTIDPRGLVGMPDMDDNVDPIEFQEYVTNSINSLRVLAEQTGGVAVVNQNDFDKALKRIDAETSDYYMIGYYSTNPDPLKRNRQIEVKIKRKDVDVWSRRSYSLRSTPRK